MVQQSALYHVKHVGDSVMVWGGILVSGDGDLVKMNGIMSAERYHWIWIHMQYYLENIQKAYHRKKTQEHEPQHY